MINIDTCVIEGQKLPKNITLRQKSERKVYYGDPKNEELDDSTVANITILKIQKCDFEEFSVNYQDFFPRLTELSIHNCRIENVNREHISKWKNLKRIFITNCDIKCLKGDIFRDLIRLEKISFKNNLLEEIEPDIFDGLNNLNFVDLRGNRNINKVAGKNAIASIKEEIGQKCKLKTLLNSEPIYFRNKIRELEQENKKLQAQNLKLSTSIVEKENKIQQVVKENERLKNLEKVVTDPAFKDFTINVDESSFRVHKLLFAGRSETLAEILKNNPEAQELNLRDIPEETFKAVHDFVYTNQLKENSNFVEVFSAANRLKIKDLVNAVAARLIISIDLKNSLEILILSNKFDHQQLREKAFLFIKNQIFPDRKLDDELEKQPEKLRKLIEMKRELDDEFKSLQN